MPLYVRLSDGRLAVELINGVDIRKWCQVGLCDGIMTSPLVWIKTAWDHDLTPYVELGRCTGKKVIAGVSLLHQTRWHNEYAGHAINPVVLARRVRDYQEQGADGIALYQSESGLHYRGVRELVPLMADPGKLKEVTRDERWLQEWPVTHMNASYALDCHCWFAEMTIDEAAGDTPSPAIVSPAHSRVSNDI